MRIVIEIEGDRVISARVEGSTSAGEPPPEVLEAARARGAVSAGRAPLNPSGAGAAAGAAAAAVPQDAGATRSVAKKGRTTETARRTPRRQGARARRTRR
jgi:hypothetical protein